ncbi:MAG: hypothetical protein ABI353_13930 [Isosphaeraceae bacterium]
MPGLLPGRLVMILVLNNKPKPDKHSLATTRLIHNNALSQTGILSEGRVSMVCSPDYESLAEAAALIARHPACPEKRDALDLCQKGADDLRESGQITEDQWKQLRAILSGSGLQSALTSP